MFIYTLVDENDKNEVMKILAEYEFIEIAPGMFQRENGNLVCEISEVEAKMYWRKDEK